MVNLFAKTLYLVGAILLRIKEAVNPEEVIDISDYRYPTPGSEEGIYRVAVFGTNDIHGSAFPLEITHPLTNETYKYGGLEYLASYVNILRSQWREKFLWLDGGDQFQGAIESKISNGSIITDFFNALQVNASAIGNHEWDFGKPFLYERLNSANWDYLTANIINSKTNKTEFLPNTKNLKLFKVGDVKIGVIGLSTVETPFTTSGDLTDIKFLEYREVIITSSKILREAGANAVVLTTHIGMECKNQYEQKMKLRIWEATTPQVQCESSDEMNALLNSLDEGVVDAVVAGHTHDAAHHWVKGVPVIQNINGGFYSNVMYLSFNATTKQIIKEKIQIEGPLPSCERIFESTKRCGLVNKEGAKSAGKLKPFSFHGQLVKGDNSIEVVFQKWWEQVKQYKVKIGYTEGTLVRDNTKETTLGNLVTDAHRNATGADIAIVNDGSLRSTWFPGNILVESLYNMYPFDNYVVSFDMTGAEVKKMFSVIQGGIKGFYHTSGVMQTVTDTPKNSLISVKLYDGSEIDDNKMYKIAANDFLANGGDDFRSVRSWYELRNYTKYGLVREMMIEYIKKVPYIKENDFIDPLKPRLKIVNSDIRKNKNLK